MSFRFRKELLTIFIFLKAGNKFNGVTKAQSRGLVKLICQNIAFITGIILRPFHCTKVFVVSYNIIFLGEMMKRMVY